MLDSMLELVRSIHDSEGQEWWSFSDVCAIHGVTSEQVIRSGIDPEDFRKCPTLGHVVNLSGFLDVNSVSNCKHAKEFRRWLFGEVLPSIRRTGSYTGDLSRLEIIQMAMDAEKERLELEESVA